MVDQDDAASAPLIQGKDTIDARTYESNDLDIPSRSRESQSTTPSAFIWALTFSAGISGLVFGYESAIHPSHSLHKG